MLADSCISKEEQPLSDSKRRSASLPRLACSHPEPEVEREAFNESKNGHKISQLDIQNGSTKISEKEHVHKSSDDGTESLISTIGTENKLTRRPIVPACKSITDDVESSSLYVERGEAATHAVFFVGLAGILLFMMLLLMMAWIRMPKMESTEPVIRSLEDVHTDMIRDLNKLHEETKQTKEFWQLLDSGLLRLASGNSDGPSVLLLAVTLDAQRSAICLAHHVADIVNTAFQDEQAPILHDTLTHLSQSWMDHRLSLNGQLKKLDKGHAVTIYNLEKMPANTATLLHGYCDHDNAPHKRAIFFLLLELGVHYNSVSPKHLKLSVERRLYQLWRASLDSHDVAQLVASVSATSLLVKPESKSTLDVLCPL